MLMELNTKWGKGDKVVLRFGKYAADNSLALTLDLAETRAPAMVVTVCLWDFGIKPRDGHIFVKDYSENEGIYACLLRNGLIKESTVSYAVNSFSSIVHECELTQLAQDEIMMQLYNGDQKFAEQFDRIFGKEKS